MEELEKRKMVKGHKVMTAIYAPHMRALVDLANELQIPRQDIVSINNNGGEVVLIYYK